jgi:enoyl-CoA hydratase/carnithine racemase
MSEIIDKSHGHLAHIRLNRADHGNRFTMEMFRRFGEILTDVDADPDLRRTLVTANCAHFSVGVAPPTYCRPRPWARVRSTIPR